MSLFGIERTVLKYSGAAAALLAASLVGCSGGTSGSSSTNPGGSSSGSSGDTGSSSGSVSSATGSSSSGGITNTGSTSSSGGATGSSGSGGNGSASSGGGSSSDSSGSSSGGTGSSSGSGSSGDAGGTSSSSGAASSSGASSGSGGSSSSSGGTMVTAGYQLPPSGGTPPRKFVNNGAACGATATWANMGNQFVADPSMTKQANKYYAFGTGGGYSTSTDLATWARGGSLFPNGLPAWTSKFIAAPGLWAPDVHLVNGTYYAYYAISAWNNFNSSIGLATTTNLDGPWTDHGDVVDYTNGGSGVNVIDPDLFVDDNGTWWLIYGSYKAGLRVIPLDPTTGKALNGTPTPTLITKSLGEGSDIIQHNGFYYVFASRGKCCAGLQSTYQVVMGRSKTVTGPYVGTNGEQWVNSQYTVFLTGDTNHPGVGGQSFFRDQNGQLYMVYMAYTAPSGSAILNVRPMWFDANDWPTLDACTGATY